MAVFISLLLALASFKLCESHGKYLSTVLGEVSKGNFYYFSLVFEGTILLELTSMSGDCDLYVSQHTVKPTYEPESYCLQSMTCGVDTVIVPKSFRRPIGIGIFGHPSHPVCQFHLLFYEIDDALDVFNYDHYSESLNSSMHEKFLHHNMGSNDNGKEMNRMEKRKKMKGEYGEETDQESPSKVRRAYYEYKSFFWFIFEYIIDCLIEVIL